MKYTKKNKNTGRRVEQLAPNSRKDSDSLQFFHSARSHGSEQRRLLPVVLKLRDGTRVEHRLQLQDLRPQRSARATMYRYTHHHRVLLCALVIETS